MAGRETVTTWTEAQVSTLILMLQVQYQGLKELLIAKAAIMADEFAVSIEARTNTLTAIIASRSHNHGT